jgi:2-phosphosulfolactate phosphatase
MPELRVHLLPSLVEPADLAGRTVVVIDVLRATTTVCHALAAGAACVVPCLEIDEARAKASSLRDALLGGERGGRKIEGFDFGNSPTEYTAERVGGKNVVFTTTNGTRALLRAAAAEEILLGAFVNLSTVANALSGRERVDLLCAGTNGVITAEDALFAGAVVDRLSEASRGRKPSGMPATLNDQAFLARDAWRHVVASGRPLATVLRDCQGGRNLIGEGFDADIDIAAQIDAVPLLPRFAAATGRITV